MTVPVNLFTGFLGVGKTTMVIELLKAKPAGERWAVLVNESGEVGIDGALMADAGDDRVTIREIAGGCLCCTTAPYLPAAIAMLMHEVVPDRLLVETTGLGHPARIIDLFRGGHYRERFELRATIGLVAPADFRCPGMFDNPVFMDQVHMADVLVLTKRDTIDDATLVDFQAWGESLFPPKLLIAAASQGVIDPNWLDIRPTHERQRLFPEAHAERSSHDRPLLGIPSPGRPIRYESPPSIGACGWVFSPNDRFCERALLALFQRPDITRAKGVFRVEHDWISMNKANGTTTVKHSAYRRDSRIELFADDVDWSVVEDELITCQLAGGRDGE